MTRKNNDINIVDSLIQTIEKLSHEKITLQKDENFNIKEQRRKEALLAAEEIKKANLESRVNEIEKAHASGKISKEFTFDKIKVDMFNQKAIKTARSFVNHMIKRKDLGPFFFILRGNEGTGKTVLSHAIANEYLKYCSGSVEIVTFDQIKDTWIYSFNENREERITRNENWDRFCTCDLLIIDSICAIRVPLTLFEQRVFSNILRERHERGLSLMVTTPLSFQMQLRDALTNYCVDFFTQFSAFAAELEGGSRRAKMVVNGFLL